MQHSTPTLKAVGSTPVGQTTYYSRLQAFAGGYYFLQSGNCAPFVRHSYFFKRKQLPNPYEFESCFYAFLSMALAIHSDERLSASLMMWL